MKYFLFLCALLASSSVFAQTQTPAPAASAPTNNEQPIEITASKTVEWLRDQNQYVARENVIVTQGNMTILSDLLTADYRDGATSSMEIWQITADGHVQIKDDANTAYGDKGVYDVIGGVAVLTGNDLKLVSPDQTVTARDRMEYHSTERLAKAIGKAKVVRPQDTLEADVITAYFKDEAATPAKPAATKDSASPVGGGSLDKLIAEGNVVITTPTEVLRGTKAIYRADTNTAEMIGKVKIERGENIMEGDRAEVDLNTNISKMFGSGKDGGRVRGVFFPGSNKKDGVEKKPVVPAPFTSTPASPVPAPTTVPEAPPQAAAPATPAPDSAGTTAPPAAKVSPRIEY